MASKKVEVQKPKKEDIKKVSAKGPTLACFFGLHAWVNGVCINCGKKRN